MSQLVIKDTSEASSDTDHSDCKKDDMRSIIRMLKSSNLVDKRFINLYKVRKNQQQGVKIDYGFDEAL